VFASGIHDIKEVYMSTSISDIIRIFESEHHVLVKAKESDNDKSSESAPDRVFGRLAFLKSAVRFSDQDEPLSVVIENVPAVATVREDDTLEAAFQTMLSEMTEAVFVTQNGTATGLVTCQAILSLLHRHEHVARMNPQGLLERATSIQRAESHVPGLAWSHDGASRHFTASQYHLQLTPDLEDDADAFAIQSKDESRANRCVTDYFSPGQLSAQAFCTSWCCELLIALCVAVDMSVGVADLVGASGGDADRGTLLATCCILAVFAYERLLRAYAFWRELLYHPFWLFDCLIVDVSALVAALVVAGVLSTDSKSTITMTRALRMLRIFLVVRNLNLSARLRRAVSSQKARYRADGFDLDLTYVTETCIAMCACSRPLVLCEALGRLCCKLPVL
jgi:hypothetical protein